MDVNENLQTIFDKLEKFFHTETVVGNPITVGEITLVPIIEVSFGLGSGGGTEKDGKGNDGSGGGAGVGARIAPNAVMVIKHDEVSVIQLKDRGSMEKVLELVPEVIDKLKNMKDEKKKESKEEKEEESKKEE
jgi:uncharacterized spore protein YtfJ